MGGFLIVVGLVGMVLALIGLVRGHLRWARIGSRRAATVVLLGALVVVVLGGQFSPAAPRDTASDRSAAQLAADGGVPPPAAPISSLASASPTTATPATAPPPTTTTAAGRASAAARSSAAAPAATSAVVAGGIVLPNRRLTPGETFPGVAIGEVCTSGWSSAHRDVTASVRLQVFAAYGIPYARHAGYELDHLVSLELGGDNSIRNLWPEPYAGTGARVKDRIENELHRLVCAHQLPLATADHAIAVDWWTAYQTYGGTAVISAPTPAPTTKAPTTKAPTPGPTTSQPSGPPDEGLVHPGAFCSPGGAIGHTSTGKPMVCRTSATYSRLRWRAA